MSSHIKLKRFNDWGIIILLLHQRHSFVKLALSFHWAVWPWRMWRLPVRLNATALICAEEPAVLVVFLCYLWKCQHREKGTSWFSIIRKIVLTLKTSGTLSMSGVRTIITTILIQCTYIRHIVILCLVLIVNKYNCTWNCIHLQSH